MPISCRRKYSSSRASWRIRLEMVVNAQSISPRLFGSEAETIFNSTRSILILACGTSYHAGLVARYWLEAVARTALQCRDRQRVPLPQPGGWTRHAGGGYLPIGRNSRHAGCPQLCQIAGAPLQPRPSAMWPKARSCVRRTCGFSPAPGRKSALPPPRHLPRNWLR